MNFFEAQREARRDSTYLLLLFLAVCSITAVGTGLVITFFVEREFVRDPTVSLFQQMLHSPLMLPITLGTLVLIGLASLFRYIGLGDGRTLAERLGGIPVSVHTANHHERKLLNVVEEMAIASGCPMPRVYVLQGDSSINAFAAGKDLRTASIGVTRGALETLSRDELQGVVAHEFSHIIFADTLLNQRVAGAVFGLFILTRIGETLLRSRRTTSSHHGRKGNGNAAIGLGLLVIGSLGLFFGRVLQAAISRKREYLADAASAQFTRNPESLARALTKTENRIENYTRPGGIEFSHMFFASMSSSLFLDSIFATHPSAEIRVRTLLPSLRGKRLQAWMKQVGDEIAPRQADLLKTKSVNKGAEQPLAFGHLVAATAGVLSQTNLAAAHSHLSALKNTIHGVFEKEGGPEAALRSLLRISSEIPDPNNALDRDLQLLLDNDPKNFLTLLQLTIFGLKEQRPEVRKNLTDEVRCKVLEDSCLRARELLMASFCHSYLLLNGNGSSSAAHVENAAVHWISFLSGLTPEGKWTRNEKNAALARIALKSLQIHRPIDDSAGIETLLNDLAILSRTSMKYKQNFLSAMWACLSSDGTKNTEEVELIRGFSLLLQVPIPPQLL